MKRKRASGEQGWRMHPSYPSLTPVLPLAPPPFLHPPRTRCGRSASSSASARCPCGATPFPGRGLRFASSGPWTGRGCGWRGTLTPSSSRSSGGERRVPQAPRASYHRTQPNQPTSQPTNPTQPNPTQPNQRPELRACTTRLARRSWCCCRARASGSWATAAPTRTPALCGVSR